MLAELFFLLYKIYRPARRTKMYAKNAPETFIGRLHQHSTAHHLAKQRHKSSPTPSKETELLLLTQKLAGIGKKESELLGLYVVFEADDRSILRGTIKRYDRFTHKMEVELEVIHLIMTCRPSMIRALYEA